MSHDKPAGNNGNTANPHQSSILHGAELNFMEHLFIHHDHLLRNPSGCAFLLLAETIPHTAVESILLLKLCDIQLLPRTEVTEAGG